jgi:hypothetical protein
VILPVGRRRQAMLLGDMTEERIDNEQAWFWTPEWQQREREADEDLAAGRVTRYEGDEQFLAALDERTKPLDADVRRGEGPSHVGYDAEIRRPLDRGDWKQREIYAHFGSRSLLLPGGRGGAGQLPASSSFRTLTARSASALRRCWPRPIFLKASFKAEYQRLTDLVERGEDDPDAPEYLSPRRDE